MFSVYGKAGRMFRGSMEELRQVGPISRASRSHVVAPVGLDPQDQNPARLSELVAPVPRDVAHRTALAAYEQTRKPGLPRHPLTRVDAVMSHPEPEKLAGQKYSQFTYYHTDERRPLIVTMRNVASREMLYCASSSGTHFDERQKALRGHADVVAAIIANA